MKEEYYNRGLIWGATFPRALSSGEILRFYKTSQEYFKWYNIGLISKQELEEKMEDLYNDKQTLANHGVESVLEPGCFINKINVPCPIPTNPHGDSLDMLIKTDAKDDREEETPTTNHKDAFKQINDLLDNTVKNKRKSTKTVSQYLGKVYECKQEFYVCSVGISYGFKIGCIVEVIGEKENTVDLQLNTRGIKYRDIQKGTFENHIYCGYLEEIKPPSIINASAFDKPDTLPYKSTETLKPEDGSKWNCKCPICGGDAYRGLSKIECKNGCDC